MKGQLSDTTGVDVLNRLLVVVYTWQEEDSIRLISARKATPQERRQYEGEYMQDEYDFSEGKRGAVVAAQPGKTRITIRLDDDILDWFRQEVHTAGGGNTRP